MNGIMSVATDRMGRQPNRKERRALRAQARSESKQLPPHLVRIDISHLEDKPEGLVDAWRSRSFLVQIHDRGGDVFRMTVSRTDMDARGNWRESISWDDLQKCKREIGFGHLQGVEIYPADSEVVNVANMRHVWIFKKDQLPFGFNVKSEPGSEPTPQRMWIDEAPQ